MTSLNGSKIGWWMKVPTKDGSRIEWMFEGVEKTVKLIDGVQN